MEVVWKAWTNPDLILQWFGSDPNGRGLKARLDPRSGGDYEISFCNRDGSDFTCHGHYLDVQPFRKLTLTWAWKNEPGVESLVTVQLNPENKNTHMQFEHAHVGSKSAHNYLEGWKSTFGKLERLLAGGIV